MQGVVRGIVEIVLEVAEPVVVGYLIGETVGLLGTVVVVLEAEVPVVIVMDPVDQTVVAVVLYLIVETVAMDAVEEPAETVQDEDVAD